MTPPYSRFPRTSAGYIRTQATSGPVARRRLGWVRRNLHWLVPVAVFAGLLVAMARGTP